MRTRAIPIAGDLARLVVPVWCPGCGARDVLWCDECAALWWQEPLRSESSARRLSVEGKTPLPVWAIAELDGPAHGMVVAWKDGSRRDLDRFFARAMHDAALSISPELAAAGSQWAVVPVPARKASTARRGANLPALLAEAAAQGLAAGGIVAHVEDVLAPPKAEQRGANVRSRWLQASRIRARHGASGSALPALLVDDVMTTGASLAAAARAIEVTFLTPGAGLCLAVAPGAGGKASAWVS